jgi:hypothetical protein
MNKLNIYNRTSSWRTVNYVPGFVSGVWSKPSVFSNLTALNYITNSNDRATTCYNYYLQGGGKMIYNMTFYARNVLLCAGISEYNASVCNGRGACIASNLCTCNSTMYSGANCELCPGRYSF